MKIMEGFIAQHKYGTVYGEEIHNNNAGSIKEEFTVGLTSPMLYDRLHILSAEYSVSVELLVNEAVKRLLDDIDFVRSLRTGQAGRQPSCYPSVCSK